MRYPHQEHCSLMGVSFVWVLQVEGPEDYSILPVFEYLSLDLRKLQTRVYVPCDSSQYASQSLLLN